MKFIRVQQAFIDVDDIQAITVDKKKLYVERYKGETLVFQYADLEYAFNAATEIIRILDSHFCPPAKRQGHWNVLGVAVQPKPKKGKLMNIRFNLNQEALLRLNPVDEAGEPVLLDADAVKLSINGVNGSGITAKVVEGTDTDDNPSIDILIRGGLIPGSTGITIKVDAEPGEGISFLEETVDVVVTPVGAVSLGLATVEIRKRTVDAPPTPPTPPTPETPAEA